MPIFAEEVIQIFNRINIHPCCALPPANYLLVDPPPGLSFTLQFVYLCTQPTNKVDLGLVNTQPKTPNLPFPSY